MINRQAVILAAALVLLAGPAHAVFRAYVASDGSDANPCTLQMPCRLLPAALAVVDTGGEVWMLDSANYNTGQVDVTRSVTILAVPGAIGSLVATGGASALVMNVAGLKVSLRNLVVVELGSSYSGVYMMQGSHLSVQSCDFSNLSGGGGAVQLTAPTGVVTISDSIVRGSSNGFVVYGGGTMAIERSRIEGGAFGVVANSSRLMLSESFVSGNSVGVYVLSQAGLPATATIRNSAISGVGATGNGINVQTTSSGDNAFVNVVNTSIMNTNGAIHTLAAVGGPVTVLLDGSSITDNVFPITISSANPVVLTRQNNTVRHNAGGDSIGTFTAVAAQ